MLTTTLWWNVGNRTFQHLQKRLLNTFAGYVASDRDVVAGLANLVHFIDVKDSALSGLDIKIRSM